MKNELTKSNCLAEVKLSYKSKVSPKERLSIKSSLDAFTAIRPLFSDDSIEHLEKVVLLVLNRANKVLGWMLLGTGGISACVVDVRVVMQVAINSNASGIILAHNHPSGNLKASQEDINITKKVKEAAKLFDINLLDHLIVTTDGYYSLSDEGLM